jgi:hypothetical protein
MQCTSSTYSETSCTVTVTGADYKSVTVTVRPGSP